MNAAEENGEDTASPAKKPDALDVHIGSRLRGIRLAAGMSQEALGAKVGVTFQQIQKYERGINRLSGSMLYRLAKIFDADIAVFFEDLPRTGNGDIPPATDWSAVSPADARTDLEVFRLYNSIESREVRKKLLRLMQMFLEP
ncbi:MAG: transcriptional regulator [Anaerolineaceae bacterium]|nr:transcriptional regulator [Anaerolineaceae bacterium]